MSASARDATTWGITATCSVTTFPQPRKGRGFMVTLVLLVLVGLCGCQSPRVHSRFSASREETYRVAQEILTAESGEAPSAEEGVLRSSWKEELGDRSQGWVVRSNYYQRVRYDVWIAGDDQWSDVEVRAHLEARPPAGRRAYRWVRLPAEERARELLVKMGRALRASTDRIEGE